MLKGSRTVLFVTLLVTGSNDCISLPVVAQSLRSTNSPCYYIRALCQTILEISLLTRRSSIPLTHHESKFYTLYTKASRMKRVKNVDSNFSRTKHWFYLKKKKAKNLDGFNFKLVESFVFSNSNCHRYDLVCAVNSFHLFLDES